MKKITLRDIAKEADVALSTVSQVLNNKANISPEMREHVLQVASELGYRHKITLDTPFAPALSTVGLLTKQRPGSENLMINPFYSYIIAGVERECQRHNMNLMYASVDVDAYNHTLTLPSMILDDLIDGVIVVGAFLEESLSQISQRAGKNMVLVDAYTSPEVAFDSVLIDNMGGALQAMAYLIENGHQHIGLIGSNPQSYPSVLERRQGYLLALAQAGITNHYIEDGLLDKQDAIQMTTRLLTHHPEITAIFACNDEVAIGVMNAVRQMGYSIPQDISVVGFDDIDVAQELMPPLTTVHVDKLLMGAMALRLLKDRATDPDRTAVKTVVSTQLIVRHSVRDLRT